MGEFELLVGSGPDRVGDQAYGITPARRPHAERSSLACPERGVERGGETGPRVNVAEGDRQARARSIGTCNGARDSWKTIAMAVRRLTLRLDVLPLLDPSDPT